jgi:hypothetical protein
MSNTLHHQLQLPSVPPALYAAPQCREIVRHEQIERQWRLLVRLLNSRYGLTLAQLQACAAEHGLPEVTDRTIRRDIDALIAAGFQIESRRTDRGASWFLVDDDTVSRLSARHYTADAGSRGQEHAHR